jgi:hypothetical protein
MLGSQVTNKQIGHDALFLELWDCNKGTTHSDTPPVFLQLQSWLCGGMFCKRTIFCVSYMWIDILVSPIIVTMKVWAVTVTSQQLVHVNICCLLLVHWPHNFHTHFSSHLSKQCLWHCEISSDFARQKRESLRHYESWQGHSTWPRRQALEKKVSFLEEWWCNVASVEWQDLCEW